MSSRRPSRLQPIPAGLYVDNPEKLARDCARAIASSLQPPQKGLNLTRVAGRRGDRFLYALTGALATNAEEKYKYKVIPLVELNSRIYWLTVSLEFSYQHGQSHLVSAGIFVFEGNASDEQKTPLVRAEWSCLPGDITGPHAQPHWHIYPSRLNRSQQSQHNFDSDPDIHVFSPENNLDGVRVQEFGEPEVSLWNEAQETEWESSESFHFAMAARWHEGNTSNQLLEVGQLPKWLSGCISYTLEQFRYIYKTKRNLI